VSRAWPRLRALAPTPYLVTLGLVAAFLAAVGAEAALSRPADTATAPSPVVAAPRDAADPTTPARPATVPSVARSTTRAAAIPAGCRPYRGNKLRACRMLGSFGLSTKQMAPLARLWQRESGWSHRAANHSSGAYGIPQALPGSKMRSAGRDWRSNPATQIKWGLRYIKSRYGTPARAWAHSRSHGWY
jgi:Transglycosylase SLT domain